MLFCTCLPFKNTDENKTTVISQHTYIGMSFRCVFQCQIFYSGGTKVADDLSKYELMFFNCIFKANGAYNYWALPERLEGKRLDQSLQGVHEVFDRFENLMKKCIRCQLLISSCVVLELL